MRSLTKLITILISSFIFINADNLSEAESADLDKISTNIQHCGMLDGINEVDQVWDVQRRALPDDHPETVAVLETSLPCVLAIGDLEKKLLAAAQRHDSSQVHLLSKKLNLIGYQEYKTLFGSRFLTSQFTNWADQILSLEKENKFNDAILFIDASILLSNEIQSKDIENMTLLLLNTQNYVRASIFYKMRMNAFRKAPSKNFESTFTDFNSLSSDREQIVFLENRTEKIVIPYQISSHSFMRFKDQSLSGTCIVTHDIDEIGQSINANIKCDNEISNEVMRDHFTLAYYEPPYIDGKPTALSNISVEVSFSTEEKSGYKVHSTSISRIN